MGCYTADSSLANGFREDTFERMVYQVYVIANLYKNLGKWIRMCLLNHIL